MKRIRVFLAGFLAILAGPASGAVNVEVGVDGTTAVVSLALVNNYDDQYTGVILKRQSVGLCEEPVLVTQAPIQLPDPAVSPPPYLEDWVEHTILVDLPNPNVNFRFEAFLVDRDGAEHPVVQGYQFYPPIASFDYAANGDAPIMRGELKCLPSGSFENVGVFDIFVVPCDDGCWGDPEWLLIGTAVSTRDLLYEGCQIPGIVDLIGAPFEPDGMMHEYALYTLTAIIPAPAGECGPLAGRPVSWSALKSLYSE